MQAMQEADAHGSGSINYSEFSAAAANMGLLLEEEALLRSLQDLDKASWRGAGVGSMRGRARGTARGAAARGREGCVMGEGAGLRRL